ncbi:MAG TPA: 50S ribosomal protein L35ae [Candidatus Nanoarchaeia archaeon]|nr:50S ribosomal protein L35ae [Candidatus Nanoarchaeia archaeon]
MEATIMNFRRGIHHQNQKQMILRVGETKEEAEKYVGKKVTWVSEGKKAVQIIGKISALHGRKGNVRAIFEEKGLPGQSLGCKVKVE